jgi:hypothetical protein
VRLARMVPKMPGSSRDGMMRTHLARIHQHLMGVVGGCSVVMRHRLVVLLLLVLLLLLLLVVVRRVMLVSRVVQSSAGSDVVQRWPAVMLLRLISLCCLTMLLLARLRVLGRVIDIVVWPYSVVARQRVSYTWVPPERAALAGRRTLKGKNLIDRGPGGRRRRERMEGSWWIPGTRCCRC